MVQISWIQGMLFFSTSQIMTYAYQFEGVPYEWL